ncbi:F-box-like domain-containing protein [Criblamydia sequanensis]|uniref:F-box and WD repeat-containing protein n=1 Tax=Candidatus Criblamydia sequanensis CRIB-18 TaxID=1437425 RepID=A0A090CYL3_9BACT|nr:F-box-like domain-containing protein [Criblamydia sequanensis]CDR33551.1 F-box and WD repeat-containing protein [Criblamydia sequanensis CRIB-18]
MQLTRCNSNLKVVSTLKPEETDIEVSRINFFDFLPEELFLLLAGYLELRTLGDFRLVCRKFNVIGSDASLIQALFKARFPILSGFYTQKEMTKELYRKAFSLEKNIHNSDFRPEKTVFQTIAFGGIRSLALSEGVLYSKHFSFPDKDILAWDLNGTQLNRFKTKCTSGWMGITKNYIFTPLPNNRPCYNALRRIRKSDKESIEWEFPEAGFWGFKAIDESIFIGSRLGFFEIDAESGLKREYLGDSAEPFFADRNQVLGTNRSSIISWDRETQEIKEVSPIDTHGSDDNLNWDFSVHAYHDDTGRIFLAGDRSGLISYDLRQRRMISMTSIHKARVSGIVFYNNEIITAGLDSIFKIWDVRGLTSLNNDPNPIRSFKIGFPINTLCSEGSSLFIGTRTIYKYDFSKEEPN